MSRTITINEIVVPDYQRETLPWTVHEIAESIKDHGYNPAYPIVLDEDNVLVDGGHRIQAAWQCGLKEVPFIRKPNGMSNVRCSLLCNADRSKGREDDVFDIAQLCYKLAKGGMSGDDIARQFGWGNKSFVTHYSNIRNKLHPLAWQLARFTRNSGLVNSNGNGLVNQEFTIVNWKESYFRSLLSHLSLNGQRNNATMRGQISVINQVIYRWQKPKDNQGKELKVTAGWIEGLAKKEAWYIKLKQYASENLKHWVGLRRRVELFRNIDNGNFGDEESEQSFEQFKKAIEALNGKSPVLIVGKAEQLPDQIGENSIDIIITSPPYNLGKDEWPMGGDGRTPREEGIGYDSHDDQKPEDEYQDWQIVCLKEMYRVAKVGASLFYNHKVRLKDGRAIHPMQWLGREDNPWTLRQEIVWDRRSTHNHSATIFWPEDERIYWLVKGDRPNIYNESIGMSTVWEFFGPTPNTWHPAPFPPELPRKCLQAIGGRGLVVLDPFVGSCTTLKVALEEFGFEAIGIDISEEYLKDAKEKNGWS